MTKKQKITAVLGVVVVVLIVGLFFAGRTAYRFNLRAHQLRSQAYLSSLYQAMKATHAEIGRYSADFETIGYRTEGVISVKFGFLGSKVALDNGSKLLKDSDELAKLGKFENDYHPSVKDLDFHKVAGEFCPDCFVTDDGFKAIAFSNIDDDPTLDVWTIDQDRNLINVSDDVLN